MLSSQYFKTEEGHKIVYFVLIFIFWALALLFLLWAKQIFIVTIIPLQLLLSMQYSDLRVASEKKKLLKELGKEDLIESQIVNTNKYRIIFVFILSIVILGIMWYITQKTIMSIE